MTYRTGLCPQKRVTCDFVDENGEPMVSLTEQSHARQADITAIMNQYDRTGLITHVNTAKSDYGDFTEVNEYQDSLNMVIAAQDAFMELPSNIRKRFGNDAGAFMEFATNPDNEKAMVSLGLAHYESTPEAILVRMEEVGQAASNEVAK